MAFVVRMYRVGIVVGFVLTLACAKSDAVAQNRQDITWDIPAKKLPLPSCASPEIQALLAKARHPDIASQRHFADRSKEEWRAWQANAKIAGEEDVRLAAQAYGVRITKADIQGVETYRLDPGTSDRAKSKQIFIYLHGGGYLFGGGMSGLFEAILIARRVGIPVLAIDYRMPPRHPYPAPIEDVVSVYGSLLETYAPQSIAIGGSSSGGGLALASVQALRSDRMRLPGGLYLGTPWADLTKTGDSFYVNEGIDRKLVAYEGFLAAAAKLYANGRDLKEPGLSPLYGDFDDLPPTILVTGTRDLFLSLAVRVHRKLRSAGVTADLHVLEGLSHVEYFVEPDAPESIETYRELRDFLRAHLR
jgi:monoterpene epsilon-lactone hydrolase